jgi:hypothetical protein
MLAAAAWDAAVSSAMRGGPGWRSSRALLAMTARATRGRQLCSWRAAKARERTPSRRSCPLGGCPACSTALRATVSAKPVAPGAAVSAPAPAAGGKRSALEH